MNHDERIKGIASQLYNEVPTFNETVSWSTFKYIVERVCNLCDANPAWRMCEDELPEEWEYVLLVWRNDFNPKYLTIVSRRIPTPNHRAEEPDWVWEHLNPKVIALCWLPLPKFNPKQETK